jgi:hypothetical protein
MNAIGLGLVVAGVMAAAVPLGHLTAQTSGDAASHRAAAVAAAGQDHPGLLAALCPAPVDTPPRGGAGRGRQGAAPAAGSRELPPRSQWHAEPVKVFDNL